MGSPGLAMMAVAQRVPDRGEAMAGSLPSGTSAGPFHAWPGPEQAMQASGWGWGSRAPAVPSTCHPGARPHSAQLADAVWEQRVL